MEGLIDKLALDLKDSRNKMSQPRKADYLFTLYKSFQSSSKPEVIRYQEKLEQILYEMVSDGASAPLRRLLKKTLVGLLTYGNISRANENIYEYLKLANSNKSVACRTCALDMVGQLFLDFVKKMPSPPLHDTLEACKKIYKTVSEYSLRIFSIKAIDSLVISRPSNLHGSDLQDISKFFLKVASDRTSEIRNRGAKAMTRLVKYYPHSLNGLYDSFVSVCIKGMEELKKPDFGLLLAEGFSVQIKPHFDPKSLNKQMSDYFPHNLIEAIVTTANLYAKYAHTEVRASLMIALDAILARFAKVSIKSEIDMSTFMTALLDLPEKSLQSENDIWRAIETMSWVLARCIKLTFSDTQVALAFEFTVNKLSTLKPLVHDSGIIEIEPAARKTTSSIIILQTSLLIKVLPELAVRLIPHQFISCSDSIYISLLSLLSSRPLYKHTSFTLALLGKRFPDNLFNLLSTLVAYTSVAHAELTSLKSEPLKDKMQESINSLWGNAHALGSVLKAFAQARRGIPYEVATSALNIVRTLISGEYNSERVDEEGMFRVPPQIFEIDTAKREAGWLILEGLVHLGYRWVGSILNTIFALWKMPFGRGSCLLDDSIGSSYIVLEVSHKKAASSSMLAFIYQNPQLLNTQIYTLLLVYASNALQFQSPQKRNSMRQQIFDNSCSQGDLRLLKKNLLECLWNIPIDILSSKISVLMQPICAEIVNDKSKVTGTVLEEWLDPEDNYITSHSPKNRLLNIGTEQFSDDQACVSKKLDISNPYVPFAVGVLDASFKLFSSIFTCSSFSINNRLKCFRYFLQHLESALKKSRGKSIKVINILTGVLGALRQLSLSKGVITDEELIDIIRTILESVEDTVQPMIKRLYAEGMIYLCKVIHNQQYIPVFIKEIEHKIIIAEQNSIVKSSIVMLIANMYRHFDINMVNKNQDALGHCIQNIANDPKVGGWAIHALYRIYLMQNAQVEHIVVATLPFAFHHYFLDYRGDFNFPETMILLCTHYIILNKNKNDSIYNRAMMVFEDMWEISKVGLHCGALLMDHNVSFDIEPMIDLAMAKLPEQDALHFFNKLFEMGYGLYLITRNERFIYDLLVKLDLFDEWTSASHKKEFRSLIKKAFKISFMKDLEKAFELLKSIVLAIEREEDASTGLSAQDTRREASAPVLRIFKNNTKTFALEIIKKMVQAHPDPRFLDDLVNLSSAMTNHDNTSFKIKGLEIVTCLYNLYHHIKDEEDSNMLKLELYETQVSYIIRENWKSTNIDIKKKSLSILRVFLITPGSRDVGVIKRVLLPILDDLSNPPEIKLLDGYTIEASASVFFKELLILSEVYLKGKAFILDLYNSYLPVFQSNLESLIHDLSIIFTQQDMSLRGQNFRLLVQVVNQDHKNLGNMHIFIKTLAMIAPDSTNAELLVSLALTFMYLPVALTQEIAINSSDELVKFVERRTTFLEALSMLINHITDPHLTAEVIHCLSTLSEIPIQDHQNMILRILANFSTKEPKLVVAAEEIILRLKSQLKELGLIAWKTCMLAYIELMYNGIPDEHISPEKAKCSIIVYFIELCLNYPEKVEESLREVRDLCEDSEFKDSLSSFVVCQLISQTEWKCSLQILSKLNDLTAFAKPISMIISHISPDTAEAVSIVQELVGLPDTPIRKVLAASVFQVFHKSTSNKDYQIQAIRLLLMVYKNHGQKEMALRSVVQMLLSIYIDSSTTDNMKVVSKTLHGLATASPGAFRQIVMGMPEHEKKYLEQQIMKSQQVAAQRTEEPSITLQFKLRRP